MEGKLEIAVVYASLGVASLVLIVFPVFRRHSRERSDARLLETILAQQSPGSGRQHEPSPVSSRRDRPAQRPQPASPQLSALEGHLRNAVIDAGARERLVGDAMRATGGDRVAAIRKVLRDLHEEDKRWS
jgi:hypothetical protein